MSLGVPVISVSEMSVINVYAGGMKRQLNDIGRLDRANGRDPRALQDQARRCHQCAHPLEIEDVVTVRDVATVVQRGEMVRQIAAEIETMIVELGVDAHLLRLQLEEVFTSLDNELNCRGRLPLWAQSFTPAEADARHRRKLRMLEYPRLSDADDSDRRSSANSSCATAGNCCRRVA